MQFDELSGCLKFSRFYIYYKIVCAYSQMCQIYQEGSSNTLLIQQCYRIRSKICCPLCTKNSPFEAIRARMKKTIGGAEDLNFFR